MRIAVLALAAAVASVAAAKNITVSKETYSKVKNDLHAKATTAGDEPTRDLPIDVHLLTQAAGLAQEPYCPLQKIGTKVGDSELLWKSEDAFFKSRVSVFKSKSLGIVISYEGTDVFAPNGYIKDADFRPTKPASVFDGILPEGVMLDHGFQSNFLQTLEKAIPAVKRAVKEHNETRVTVTGHSLGAAASQLAAVYLDHELEHGIKYYLGFAPPRVGNQKFADYVDEKLKGRFYYAINGDDIVPRVPPRLFGYQHPSGQIWITPSNSDYWLFCPGQENKHCSNSVTPIAAFPFNHLGTYFHTLLGWGPLLCPPNVGDAHNIP